MCANPFTTVPVDAPTGRPLALRDKVRVLSYLRRHRLVLAARSRVDDRYDPAAERIPVAYFTDGTYLWSEELTCYLERHDLELPEGFVAYLQALDHEVTLVDDAAVEAARRWLVARFDEGI